MFDDVLFPEAISYGSKGGPRFSTTILTLASGKERRNQNWVDVRAEYDVSHGIKDRADMAELRDFFYGRRGKAHSFRFFDHADNQIINQVLEIGDGERTRFQLVKTYSPTANPYVRNITKPIQGTLGTLFVGSSPVPEAAWNLEQSVGAGSFALNYASGEILFGTPPPLDAVITLSSINFHVHVRFDTDLFESVHDFWEIESWDQVLLIEIKDAI